MTFLLTLTFLLGGTAMVPTDSLEFVDLPYPYEVAYVDIADTPVAYHDTGGDKPAMIL